MPHDRKLLVVQVAGLSADVAAGLDLGQGLSFAPMEAGFPALTCPAQATFRTALASDRHGVWANGYFDAATRRTAFWEQSAALVHGPRIWDAFRADGGRVGLLFWQQSLGDSADLILSPAPIHKHHGGMIDDCYSKPAGLYERLARAVGRPFRLMRYWGPFASVRSSQWIAEATAALLSIPDLAPDLCLTYLPGLDYDLQRHGPRSRAARHAFVAVGEQLAGLAAAAGRNGYATLVFGDYAIAPCSGGPVFPNCALRAAGLLNLRQVRGMSYLDLFESRAFALCDHEVALVHVRANADVARVRETLAALAGVARVMEVPAVAGAQLLAVAADSHWFAYPWWHRRAEAPDYARHVDIHNKPGYDPCELLLGWPPGTVSLNPRRIRGSHGRVGAERRVVWASNAFSGPVDHLAGLAARTRDWLNGQV